MTTMNNRSRLIILAGLSCLISLPTAAYEMAPGSSEGDPVKRLFEAWESQQARVRRVRLKWSETVVIPKSEISKMQEAMAQREARAKKVPGSKSQELKTPAGQADAKAMTGKRSNSFLLSGNTWRWNLDSFMLKGTELVPQKEDLVVKDGIAKSFLPAGGIDYPIGNINKASGNGLPKSISLKPLFFALRSSAFGLFDPSEYVVSTEVGTIDDVRCTVFTSKKKGWVLWADLGKPGQPLRRALSDNVQIDISYRFDEPNGLPVLKGWTILTTGTNKQLREAVTAHVSECSYDADIDAKEFNIDFPPGTWVRDFTRSSSLGDRAEYLIKEDGQARPVEPIDRGASYQKLLTTEAGQSSQPPWYSSGWLIVANGVIIGALGVYLFARRFRQPDKSTKGNMA